MFLLANNRELRCEHTGELCKIGYSDNLSMVLMPLPYTLGLLNYLPSNTKYKGAKRLEAIQGTVPDLLVI